MARRPPIRVFAWLMAAFLANVASPAVGIIADLRGDPGWALPVRGGLLIVSVLCFAVFFWRWWRWHRVDRAAAER